MTSPAPESAAPAAISSADPWAPLPGADPVPLHEMPAFGCCRWPVDPPAGSGFFQCGAATDDPLDSYCATHMAMAYRPTRRRARKGGDDGGI